ncbi:MAG TPA: hypothetical protein VK511_13490 [Gemmatimonadaceae bacterium]|nr:hypothetical protein [Gemmatimonadaceae bacterium]
MPPIRIVLAEMPQLLHEIFATHIASTPDMEEIGGAETRDSATALVRQGAASVVIVGLNGSELPVPYGRMLRDVPGSRVYAIRDGGRSVWLHEMYPRSESLGDLAPSAVLTSIREGT